VNRFVVDQPFCLTWMLICSPRMHDPVCHDTSIVFPDILLTII
jgi:hypothetical protein